MSRRLVGVSSATASPRRGPLVAAGSTPIPPTPLAAAAPRVARPLPRADRRRRRPPASRSSRSSPASSVSAPPAGCALEPSASTPATAGCSCSPTASAATSPSPPAPTRTRCSARLGADAFTANPLLGRDALGRRSSAARGSRRRRLRARAHLQPGRRRPARPRARRRAARCGSASPRMVAELGDGGIGPVRASPTSARSPAPPSPSTSPACAS